MWRRKATKCGVRCSNSFCLCSIGLTSLAIAEDLHALGVVFLDILFNGVLTKAGAAGSGGGAGGVGEVRSHEERSEEL